MKYRVWIRSKPGMCEQYDGYVEVTTQGTQSWDMEDIFRIAVQKLRRGAFPDRGPGMWKCEGIELVQ